MAAQETKLVYIPTSLYAFIWNVFLADGVQRSYAWYVKEPNTSQYYGGYHALWVNGTNSDCENGWIIFVSESKSAAVADRWTWRFSIRFQQAMPRSTPYVSIYINMNFPKVGRIELSYKPSYSCKRYNWHKSFNFNMILTIHQNLC